MMKLKWFLKVSVQILKGKFNIKKEWRINQKQIHQFSFMAEFYLCFSMEYLLLSTWYVMNFYDEQSLPKENKSL